MTTALLILPVLCVLVWLYWFLLPGRNWRLADTLILGLVVGAASLFICRVEPLEVSGAGPIWSFIVSAAGAYSICALGLAAGLFWRRRKT
jgi:hypothetical protein